jgi:hypothetical protein
VKDNALFSFGFNQWFVSLFYDYGNHMDPAILDVYVLIPFPISSYE